MVRDPVCPLTLPCSFLFSIFLASLPYSLTFLGLGGIAGRFKYISSALVDLKAQD